MSIYRKRPQYTPRPSLLHRVGTVLFFLLLLAGFLSAIFLFFFRGYVVDTPDGPHLELPFLAKESATLPVASTNVSVTVPEADSRPLLEPLHAIRLSCDTIMDGSAHDKMQKAGCNAVIYDMRTDDGSLNYVSDLNLAIESGASAALPNLNDAIRSMNASPDLYTIARVSCFSDSKLAKLKPELALSRASGATWMDDSKVAWLSPNHDEVQSYLYDICRELGALGFDEILLTNCAYPTKGTLSQISGSEDSVSAFSASLEDFYRQMRTIANAKGVRLSICWESSEGSEEEKAASGQTLESLVLSADRVWMKESYAEAVNVFSSHGLSCSNFAFVSILSNPGKSSFSWAIL